MAKETGFTSIAEALAAAQQAPRKTASIPSVAARRRPAPSPVARPAVGAAGNDLLDEFDHAIDAVTTARKAMPRDAAAATKMATNIVMAKCKVRQADAVDLVQRAIRYLDK